MALEIGTQEWAWAERWSERQGHGALDRFARGVGRRREFAVRTALGARSGRLAAQVVTETCKRSVVMVIVAERAGVE